MGVDAQANAEFQRIADNWNKLTLLLDESGVLPSLLVKITSAYAAGYSWVEVTEEDDGTYTVLSGGKASGSGVFPKAFEQNGGTADFTNLIAKLELSHDKDTSAVTASFDGKAVRVAANDINALPSNPSFAAGVLTIHQNTFQMDIKGRVVGSAIVDRTVTVPTGAVDLENSGVATVPGATFINIPASTNDVMQFANNAAGGDLQFTAALDRQGHFYNLTAAKWKNDWVRGHP